MEPSQARRELLESVVDEVRHHHPSGRILVAVDGPDASGKSRFADDLADAFRGRGVAVFRASVDDFERPREERYRRGRFDPEGCYRDSFDYDALASRLLTPFRRGEPFVTAVFDLERDAPVDAEQSTAPEDAVLIVDGVFLNRPELRSRWHHSIWLDADAEVRAERMRERDGIDPGSEQAARYVGAQRLYYREGHPNTAASSIIDNTDPDAPMRRFADYCTIQPPP